MTIPDPALPSCASLPELLTRRRAALLIFLLWAAIYVPALGSLEIKGEEGRRLLPAVSMLATGRWVVPSIGGVDYLSKPPLINWLVAGSFKLTGNRTEWAARAPSALSVLALGLTTLFLLSAGLTPAGALMAAVFMLTNIGLMEKGRLAEIEALYISLFGLALLTWLSGWWSETASPWRTWTLPGVFLGLGLLTKGPLNLVFYYVIVITVLAYAGRLRALWSVPHLVGIVLMLLIFAAWFIPYLHQTAAGHVGSVWRAQVQGRLEVGEKFRTADWLLNIPRGLGNYVPWVLFVPLVWRRQKAEGRKPKAEGPVLTGDVPVPADLTWQTSDPQGPRIAFFRGGRLAVAVCFLAVNLAPGGVPRYTLPLLVPMSILLAVVFIRRPDTVPPVLPVLWSRIVAPLLALASLGALVAAATSGAEPWRWAVALLILLLGAFLLVEHSRFRRWGGAPVLALSSAGVMGLITADYSLGAIPHIRQSENVRPLAQKVNRLTAASGEAVHVFAPGFLPFLYYLRPGPIYVQTVDALPTGSHYLLVRDQDLDSVAGPLKAAGRPPQTLRRLDDKNRGRWDLLRVGAARTGSL